MFLRFWSLIWMFAFLSESIFPQSDDLGSWNILNIRYNLSEKWIFFAEGQLRSLKFYNHYHYYEYKGGINFRIFEHIKLTLAAGSYQTYAEGGDFITPKNNDEFRLWPQIILFQTVGKFKIEQRYRTEFRWTSVGYRTRYRYRFGISLPFGRSDKGFKPFQLMLSNELFFSEREPYFERNRLFGALNYKPVKNIGIQAGYIHQFDYKINDEIGRDFFVIGLYVEINRKNPPQIENELKDN
jgi:hypothetical protein